MKKIIPIFAVLLACFFSECALAATGSIEIEVPKEAEVVTVNYGKRAEWKDTNKEEFKGEVDANFQYTHQVEIKKNENIKLTDLEEGIYQIQIIGNEEYEFAAAVVSVPAWNEETNQMEYGIRMVPKYIRHVPDPAPEPQKVVPKEEVPNTGDKENAIIYVVFGGISLLIVIMSCHKYFKCARMTE